MLIFACCSPCIRRGNQGSKQNENILIHIDLFWTLGVLGQDYDRIGTDDNPMLNENEAELLNSLLNGQRGGFDFSEKKVAFITGSNGGKIVSKSIYFRDSVIPWVEKNSKSQIFMVELNEEEKLKSGGYDVLVLSWVKVFTKKAQEKVITRLANEM